MEKFRNLTKNIFFKIFLSFLGLSFIMFGVGDFIMGTTNSWVAKVDGNKISYNDFIKTADRNKEFIYRSQPSDQTLQYLNSAQFKEDTLRNMVNKIVIGSIANDFGLYPDKNLILQDIASHPKFTDSNGQFNRIAFINFLKINGLSEEKYVEDVSRETVSQIVVSSLIYSPLNNDKLARELYQQKEEKRIADVVVISTANLPKMPEPDKKKLAEFFAANQQQFVVPEIRKVSYAEFSDADLAADNVSVSEDEILESYNNSPIYTKPASKDFYHLVFEDEKSAKKFLNALDKEKDSEVNKEKSFLDLAAKLRNRQKEDILMADIGENDILPEIRKDVSALSVGNYSKVLKSSLGYHIFYLVKQNPQTRYPLTEKMKAEIKENLISEKKEKISSQKMEAIEDEALLAQSLQEFAKKFGFKVNELEQFTKEGIIISNPTKNIAAMVKLDEFIPNSFAAIEKQVSQVFYSKSNKKYYVLFVDHVAKSRNKTLDEVFSVVSKMFVEKQKQEKLQELSNKIYAELQKGGDAAQIAQRNNLKLQKGQIFNRSYQVSVGGKEVEYANDFVKNLFVAKAHDVLSPERVSNQEINIAILKEIVRGKVDEAKLQQFKAKLASDFRNNIIAGYDQYLAMKYPVKINEKMFDKEGN